MQRDHMSLVMDTFRLNMSMCNKCYVLKYRGKQPYIITQCGHIFCQDCWQNAHKQCTLCGNIEVGSLELNEQMPSKLKPIFEPFSETLKTLSFEITRIDEFRDKQLKITMQRFIDLEKKYDLLKNHFWTMRQDMKILTRKCKNLKSEKDELNKKLLSIQIQQDTIRAVPSTMQTPMNSNIFIHPCSSGYSSESMGLQSIGVTPIKSVNPIKPQKIVGGFRVPVKRNDMINFSMNSTSSNSRDLFLR